MIFTKIMEFFEWIMHFVYLNALFVAGTLIGGIVLGFFPACYATISVSRRLVSEPGFGIAKAFFEEYKQHFWKSLRVGYLFVLVVLITVSNVIFWRQLEHMISWVWLFILILTVLGSMLLFPVTVENNLSLKETGKLFFYSLSQLHLYIVLILGLGVIYMAILFMTGVFIFLAGSLSLTWVMFTSHLFVRKIQKIRELK